LVGLAAASARATEVTIPRVDYGSDEWVHSVVPWSGVPGFQSRKFDDSAWNFAAAPFGTGCYCGVTFTTFWPLNTDLLVCRWIDVPANGRIRVGAQIDNEVQAFVDGIPISVVVSTVGCSGAERYTALSPPQVGGPTLVAVRARGLGGCSHLDLRIEIVFDADCNSDGFVDYAQILAGEFVDADSDNIPDFCEPAPCPGDITGGGQINGVDLAAILGAWGTDGQGKLDCDINDDGTVDAQDLAIVLGGWGNCP
jgi:hypothetical protein